LAIGATQLTIGFAQEWLAWHDRKREDVLSAVKRAAEFIRLQFGAVIK
jgi:hypothetical protein